VGGREGYAGRENGCGETSKEKGGRTGVGQKEKRGKLGSVHVCSDAARKREKTVARGGKPGSPYDLIGERENSG